MFRTLRKRFAACLVFLFSSAVLLAQVDPSVLAPQDRRPVDAKFFQHADLTIGNLLVAPAALRSSETSSILNRLAGLGTELVSAVGRVDRRGDRFGTVLLSKPLLPGANALTWNALGVPQPRTDRAKKEAAWRALQAYIEKHAGALRVNLDELHGVKVTLHSDGDFIQVSAKRRVEGMLVRGAGFSAAIRKGNLVMYGFHRWGDVTVPTPTLAAGAAADSLNAYLAPLKTEVSWEKAELTLVPVGLGNSYLSVDAGQGYHHRLAWTLYPILSGDLNSYKALVDANSGQVLEFRNAGEFLSVEDARTVSSVSRGVVSTREVVGGVYPKSNDGLADGGVEQPMWPMPFATVTTTSGDVLTDTGGQLPACYAGNVSTALAGRYLTVIDACGLINESDAGSIDMGTSGGIDCTVPGGASAGDTHASRSAFYEIGRIQEMARAQLPGNAWLDSGDLVATLNINANCNAGSGGNALSFFTSGGGCSNTGELAGVFDHEWGHSMDAFDATPGVSNPGEGIADIYASLRLNDSCLGRNFRPGVNCGGYGDPCTACTGVRDIDFANRFSTNPHTIAFIIGACGVASGAPCGGSVHCESAVYSEAVWDLWHRDLQTEYGTDLDSARELAALLSFQGSGAVGSWFNCNPGGGTGDGCNADGGYLNYLAVDDDDANLLNGTPHMTAIHAAFDRHGIACATPTVQDSGCAGSPTAAATVTLTPLDRAVSLSWTSVTNTTTYQVFRAEGIDAIACDYGKVLIGEVDSGITTFLDAGLRNGRKYSYIVIPKGGSASCFGPSSACQSTMPISGASVAFVASDATFTPDAGDGDTFVDNGEVATLSVPLLNLGSTNSDNVRLVSATVTSHPGFTVLTAGGTVFSATLSNCSPITASVQVQAAGLSGLGDVVQIEVQVTSDQLSPLAVSQTFSFDNTNGNFLPETNFTFDYETSGGSLQDWIVSQGIFALDGPGDGSANRVDSSDGLNNQCDRVVSPPVIFSATSTMAMSTNFDIEEFGAIWWDRATVAILHANGTRTVVNPDGGRVFNASGAGDFSGCTAGDQGWGGVMDTWAGSSWSAGTLGITPGELVRVEVSYGTDALAVGRGFWFDNVAFTDFQRTVLDDGAIFADGFESGGTGAWSP